jgi:hypothetical protein
MDSAALSLALRDQPGELLAFLFTNAYVVMTNCCDFPAWCLE